MNMNTYQKESRRTATYPNAGTNMLYPILGLCGESGEVEEKMKKIIRDKQGICTDEDRMAIAKELGDVLWYMAQIATELNLSLDEIAETNLEKLRSRMERGTIHGNGDNR